MKVSVISGDISRIASDSMITSINSSGMWFSGIDGVIRRSKGNLFHSTLVEKANVNGLPDGKPFFIPGSPDSKSFQNVIFVIDDLKKKLHEIVLNGLVEAEKNEQTKVTIPTIRMGVMLGVVEKSEDEAIDEMVQGVELFKKTTPLYVNEIDFVVYSNEDLADKLRKKLS